MGLPGFLCKRVYVGPLRIYFYGCSRISAVHNSSPSGTVPSGVGAKPRREEPPPGPPPAGRTTPRPAPLPSERPSAPHLPSRSAANGRAGVGLTRCAAASSGGGRALPEPRRFGGSFEASGAEAARHPATASRPRPRLAQREVCAWLQLRPPGLHGASCAEHSARLRLATHEAAPERFAAAAVGERRACPASRGRAASSFPRFLLFEDRGGPGPPRQRELCGAAVLENLPPRSLLTPQTPS